MSLSLPDDVLLIAAGLPEYTLYVALREFIEALPGIAHDQEIKINAKMATLAPGAHFFGLLVEDVDSNHLTLVKTFDNVEVKYPVFDRFPPRMEKIEGLKLNLFQPAVKIKKHVNLTDSHRAVIDVTEVVEVTLEIEFSRSDYTIRIGGGVDKLRRLEQYLVHIDLKGPPLHFHGFLATSGGGGLLFKVHSGLPVPIPLGTSCFALTGVGMLYGEHFAPWVSGNKPTDSASAMAALGNATAEDYVTWAQLPDLNQWVPVDPDVRIFGLTADVGDVGTAGHILELQEAGLTYISHGPTLVFGGRLNFLEANIAKVTGAIDLPSQSFFLSMSAAALNKVDELKISGSIALSASFKDQTRTWAAIGGYDMKGCVVDVLDGLITLKGGFRVVPFQGAAARGEARVQAEGSILGIEGGYSFYIGLMGAIGWNPAEVGGQLDIGGSIWVKIWGEKLGGSIDAHLAIQIARPLKLHLWGQVSLDLPWPLPSIEFPVEIFDFDVPVLAAPLAGFALLLADTIPFYFAAARRQGELDAVRGDVWPDVAFDLPFRRLAAGPGHIVNRAMSDNGLTEAGITTSHAITRLEIMRVDQNTGAEQAVAGLFAAWMATSAANGVQRTSRLAFPSNDPLAWLQAYNHSQPVGTDPLERVVFQTFGAGRDEVFFPNGGSAQTTVENLHFESRVPLRISNLPWVSPYPRALTATAFTVQVRMEILGQWLNLAVLRYDVRLVTRGEPSVQAPGLLRVEKVRDLERGFTEWSAIIEPAPADRTQAITLDGVEGTLVVPAVGYTLDETGLYQPGTQTVLQPGIYRLYIEGHSDATYRTAHKHLDWPQFVREFRVVPPDSLRPYLRYATFGDERAFGVDHGGWNPNPSSFGFGHYLGHEGVVRSHVGYLSRIFDRLWVSTARGDAPVAVQITQCQDNSVAGGKLGEAWPDQTGGQVALEEELRFPLPNAPGNYEIEILRSDTNDGLNLVKMDSWPYRVSKFASPTEHLKPASNALGRAFGPFGTRYLHEAPLPDLVAGFDFDTIAVATPIAGWSLPKWIQHEPSFESPDLSLTFLRLFDWCGFFAAEPDSPEERATSRPAAPSIDLLMDSTSRPIGLLLRTAEPVDWRRAEATLVQGDGQYDRRFGVRIYPSPDGCSAVLIGVAGGLAVRLPAGQFAVRLVFRFRLGDLPSLIDRARPADTEENITFTFAQAHGRGWNV